MTPDPIQGAAPKIGRAEGLCGNTSRPLHYIAATVLGLGFTAILVLLAFTHMSNLNETAFEASAEEIKALINQRLTRSVEICLLYTSPSPRDGLLSRMPSSA